MTLLDKSFGDWANVKDPTIVPLATEEIDTIDEDYEVDVPNLIPPDHVSDDKSMVDDDHTCQGDDLWILVPSILKHGNYDFDDEDFDDDELQESAIQMDLEGYNAEANENEVNEQPRSATMVIQNCYGQCRILRHLSILKLWKWLQKQKVGMNF